MNRYVHAASAVSISALKFGWLKLERRKNVKCSLLNLVSPRTEITVDKGGKLSVGKMFKMRDNCKLRVRKNAEVTLGDNFSMGSGCIITSYEKVEIGDNVQFGPGVLVYDQDHDVTAPGGLAAEQYKTGSIKIGNNVWIGANAIILRNTVIGDNSVVAAGSVLKGEYPKDSMIYQKKETKIKPLRKEEA